MQVREIVARLLDTAPGPIPAGTVDTLKCGDPKADVARVAMTFLATVDVIERAAALGVRMIVTHEPTFYNHFDDPAWGGLDRDEVAVAKRALLDRHGIAVFRYHDAPHRMRPDAILAGVLDALGWTELAGDGAPQIVALREATAIRGILAHCAARLGAARPVLAAGAGVDRPARRIAVMVGACGGQGQIRVLREQRPDLLVCGELNEWETCEYARDAVLLGWPTTVAVLGHATSEEAGMRWLSERMRPLLPGVDILHLPASDSLRPVDAP